VQRIFEPGFRVAAAAETHQGAGLGLALAQRLAHAADGSIRASVINGLTTFEVTLPAG
jgi:signal transduction histidine kinase